MPEEGLTRATPVINLPTGLDTKRSGRQTDKSGGGGKTESCRRADEQETSNKEEAGGARPRDRQAVEAGSAAIQQVDASELQNIQLMRMLSARDKTALFIKRPPRTG